MNHSSTPTTQDSLTENAQNQHIAIVGGGMVGLSLALMLAKQLPESCAISLIEKIAFPSSDTHHSSHNALQQPSFDARSTAISAGSAELLKAINVWPSLAAETEAINTIHISDRGHYANTRIHADDYSVDALGYVVENRHLGRALLQQLPDTRVSMIAPASVECCKIKADHVELTVASDTQKTSPCVHASLLVVADGADSLLCQSLGIAAKKTAYQQSAIIANVALKQVHKGVAYERFTEQGPLALLPLSDCDGQHRAAIVWTRNSDVAESLCQASDTDFMAQLQNTMGYRAGQITQVGSRYHYPLTLIEAEEQIRSRIVVMGNAAHFLHPVAGQGFNLSLRDCAVLAKTLADNHQESVGDLSLLNRYQTCREKDQQLTIALTDSLVKAFSSTTLSHSVFRQCGLLSLQAIPMAKNQLAQQMMGLA
ncbi:2-octaprenyl-6-methoxyphenyl hydroxylase [Eionea flava]